MIDKVIDTIEKCEMLQKGDSVVIGLSGGPDSVALLHVLNRIKKIYDLKLYAVHLNHMIRGEEALRDEESAENFAKSLSVPFYSKRIDVNKFAKDKRMSSEEAGRFLRYQLFEEVAKKVDANRIALAHNMNDQAETIIMHFLRGSGISGLTGISPVRGGVYIRPILYCTRDEIEAYCMENNLNPVLDSTNKESIYNRNKIRLQLIPYVKENFNPRIIENLSYSADILRDEEDFLNRESCKAIEEIRIDSGFSVDMFNRLHYAIKRRIIRILILEVKGDLNGMESKHIEECIRLIEKGETGKSVNLPCDIVCEIQYNVFKIKILQSASDFEYNIKMSDRTYIKEINGFVDIDIIQKRLGNYKDSEFIKFFDYDKIIKEYPNDNILIRNRRNGDYIYPRGMSGKKKVKEIFIDKKITRDERHRIPLLAIGNEVLWILNVRDSRKYKPDENSENILKIKFERGAFDD